MAMVGTIIAGPLIEGRLRKRKPEFVSHLRGPPIPASARASGPWGALLEKVPDARSRAAGTLVSFCRHTRVTLADGTLLEPLPINDAYVTVAALRGQDPSALRDEHLMEVIAFANDPEQARQAQREELAELRKALLAGVKSIEEVTPPSPRAALPKTTVPENEISPPWSYAPEPPESMRWRMGPGEDHMNAWWEMWSRLNAAGRTNYFQKHPPPAPWSKWSETVLTTD
jgi:hypothetical protein